MRPTHPTNCLRDEDEAKEEEEEAVDEGADRQEELISPFFKFQH